MSYLLSSIDLYLFLHKSSAPSLLSVMDPTISFIVAVLTTIVKNYVPLSRLCFVILFLIHDMFKKKVNEWILFLLHEFRDFNHNQNPFISTITNLFQPWLWKKKKVNKRISSIVILFLLNQFHCYPSPISNKKNKEDVFFQKKVNNFFFDKEEG